MDKCLSEFREGKNEKRCDPGDEFSMRRIFNATNFLATNFPPFVGNTYNSIK